MSYLKKAFTSGPTPQSLPIPGSTQVPNSAGGYAWPVDNWKRLQRFLILGSEGGTYYQKEQALTIENANAVLACIKEDGPRAVRVIADVSTRRIAPKNDPALFALALAASYGNDDTRHVAFLALPMVARTGTHILHFVEFAQQFRGWGRGLKTAVGKWFLDRPARDLAYQAVKYQNRDGWTLRDLLRLSHPNVSARSQRDIINWIAHGWEGIGPDPHPDTNLLPIWAMEKAKRATDAKGIVQLIQDYDLVRECIPTQFLTNADVWEALLQKMPLEAMVRNLPTMTKVGLLTHFSDATRLVCQRLEDQDWIVKAGLHPIKLLVAHLTYATGHSIRGDSIWTPVAAITDELNDAFYLAFGAVQPMNKRVVLALDISGSMGCSYVNGMPFLSARQASAALALITAATEPRGHVYMCGFSTEFINLPISPRQRLDDVIRTISNLPFGGTDCSLPMREFLRTGQGADAFVIYTDSETWAGNMHASQALQEYRRKMQIPDAKLAVVALTSNGFSIADPNDAGQMDFVGLSTDMPQVLSSFVRGDV